MFSVKVISKDAEVFYHHGIVTWVSLTDDAMMVEYADKITRVRKPARAYYTPYCSADVIAGKYFSVGQPVNVVAVGADLLVCGGLFNGSTPRPVWKDPAGGRDNELLTEFFMPTDGEWASGYGLNADPAGTLDFVNTVSFSHAEVTTPYSHEFDVSTMVYTLPLTGNEDFTYPLATDVADVQGDLHNVYTVAPSAIMIGSGNLADQLMTLCVEPTVRLTCGWVWKAGSVAGVNTEHSYITSLKNVRNVKNVVFPTKEPAISLVIGASDHGTGYYSDHYTECEIWVKPVGSHKNNYSPIQFNASMENVIQILDDVTLTEALNKKIATLGFSTFPWRADMATNRDVPKFTQFLTCPYERNEWDSRLYFGMVENSRESVYGEYGGVQYTYTMHYVRGYVDAVIKPEILALITSSVGAYKPSTDDFDYTVHSISRSETLDYPVVVDKLQPYVPGEPIKYIGYLNCTGCAGGRPTKLIDSQRLIPIMTDGDNNLTCSIHCFYDFQNGVPLMCYEKNYYINNLLFVRQSLFQDMWNPHTGFSEIPYFRHIDLVNGFIITDTVVVDLALNTSRTERRLYDRSALDGSGYYVIWTIQETNPSRLPDGGEIYIPDNFPPWTLVDETQLGLFYIQLRDAPVGSSTLTANHHLAPWFNYSFSSSPPEYKNPDVGGGYPASLYRMPNLKTDSAYQPRTITSKGTPYLIDPTMTSRTPEKIDTSVMPTADGWISSNPCYAQPDNRNVIHYHFGSSVVEKNNGAVAGIDPNDIANKTLTPFYSEQYPENGWGFPLPEGIKY